jgi:hypothetical protein
MLIDKYTFNKMRQRSCLLFFAALTFVLANTAAWAQTSDPASAGEVAEPLYNGYRLSSTTEIGWRFRSLEGSESKYRSDLNYKAGFRTFDTNLLLEAESGKGKYFDNLLISNSGWGSDPTGNALVSVDKTGFYKFKANVRRIKYFNDLVTHVNPTGLGSQHTQNIKRNFGDFDFTLFPQNETIRFTVGTSFNKSTGPGSWTARGVGDEFQVNSTINTSSYDFRIGADGKFAGFGWGLTQGFRTFKDRSFYESGPSLGNTVAGNPRIESMFREFPTSGRTSFTQFHTHRTFADRFDITGRFLYSGSKSLSSMMEIVRGRNAANDFVDLDRYTISGEAKRTQTRADIGFTYRATQNFRISNTFNFDQFGITGDEDYRQDLIRRNAAGNNLAPTLALIDYYRLTGYRRFINTLEGDYQFGKRAGIHLGWRHTQRRVKVDGFNFTLTSAITPTNPRIIAEEEENTANALIAGMKLKPTRNWVIYWSVEHGSADNVFTRLENYEYTNFKMRTRLTLNKFALNFSAVTKDNSNPSFSIVPVANEDFTTEVSHRTFAGSLDWTPVDDLTLSGGYTYRKLDSFTPILIPISGRPYPVRGTSEFYARDHYAHFDVSARPAKRISLFASYRISKDTGQDEFSNTIENIITSYPMNFHSPEFRIAFRVHRNVDWNFGYQYYKYTDDLAPVQNYRAHLPYTSLRIYFGGRAADR